VSPLWSNIFRKKAEEESLSGFLHSVPVFGELGSRDLAFLERIVHVRHYHPHEIVFEEGDPGSGMYVLRAGRVKIFLRQNETDEQELTQLGPGDFFGETTLTAPAPRSASVRTLDNTTLIGLFRADLLETALKNPAVANRILLGLTRVVSERLQAAGQELFRLQRQISASESSRGTRAEAGRSPETLVET
jgi:CRP-like cAMP-binding protein